MTEDFVWFNPVVGTPTVSLANYGISFSKSAVHAMGTPAYVKLGFDSKNKKLAIKVCGEDDKRKIEFAEKEKNGNVRINSKDFIRMLNSYMPDIVPNDNTAIRYTGVWDEKDKVMLVDLKAPLNPNEIEGNDI